MGPCTSCARELPGDFPFCPFCGSAVQAAPAPAAVLERKVVTALFCDLVGSTAAAEGADPEDVRARLGTFHRVLRARLEAFGGTVEKFAGDAVLAVFGAPVSHEDDAERAVRAGLSILDELAALNVRVPSLGLHVRIGVNTGETVVDLAASSGQGDAFVFGDVVNTAARLQSAGPVDAVVVGALTRRTTDRVVEYEALDPVAAKGKSEPLPLWRARRARSRVGVDVMREVAAPMVGREPELEVLLAAFDRCCDDRASRVVTVVADPGMGKSRLVGELFARIDQRPDLVTWRQGRCPPYGDGLAYRALGEIVKAEAGIDDADDAATTTTKLDAVVDQGDDHDRLLLRLLPLVGVDTSVGTSPVDLHGAWIGFLGQMARRSPLVMVVEDLHWADPAMLDFLDLLAGSALDAPLLVVATARPALAERRPDLVVDGPGRRVVRLAPLGDDETDRLVTSLLEGVELPDAVSATIREQAAGNPLYAEEFVRMLRDEELLDQDGGLREGARVPVPEGVHALIAARLDAVPASEKAVLQAAAVVGKVFTAEEVSGILERDVQELDISLEELRRREYVRAARRTSGDAVLEYSFWHVLVRDVAYAALSRASRARMHGRLVDWLTTAGRRPEDIAEIAVHHAAQALGSAEAVGDGELAARMRRALRDQSAIAGEHALALDARAADLHLARACELTDADDPAWVHVAALRVQSLFATNALDDCAALGRALVERVEAVPALLESIAVFGGVVDAVNASMFSDGAWDQDIVGLFRRFLAGDAPESPGRVAVTGYLANHQVLLETDDDIRAGVALAGQAREAAERLGCWSSIAEATEALGRCLLGEPEGLDQLLAEVRHLRETTSPRYVVLAYGWLLGATAQVDGPDAALALYPEIQRYEADHGMDVLTAVDSPLRLLVAAGRVDEALGAVSSRGWDLAAPPFCAEDILWLHGAAGRPHPDARDVVLGLIHHTEESGGSALAEFLQHGVGLWAELAAADLLHDDAASAKASAQRINPHELARRRLYCHEITNAARAFHDLGMVDELRALTDQLPTHTAYERNNLLTVRALLLSAEGRHVDAAAHFGDAATTWRRFTHRLEAALALRDQGRSLLAAGDAAAPDVLGMARARFEAMGAAGLARTCDALTA